MMYTYKVAEVLDDRLLEYMLENNKLLNLLFKIVECVFLLDKIIRINFLTKSVHSVIILL